MFKVREVAIFDTAAIQRDDFITYCVLQCGDEGDYQEEGHFRNAIVSYVEEDYISVINSDGVKKQINAKQVEGTPGYIYGPNGIRIKGIARSVISVPEE
jgi:hypothetical protein